ncbi:MAG: GNAT family N-acetyltransferase [Planctomycetota bacterium]|jgi:ribosomal protein S18 acetylase RimI-like enzyme
MNESDRLLSEILRCEHQVWQAVIEKDGEKLADLFTDEYVEITLSGQRVIKSDVVTESPQIDQIEAYSIGSEEIRSLGPDAALLSYHLTLDGTCRGIPIVPRDRWATSIWKHRQIGWRCSFFQQSAFSAGPDRATRNWSHDSYDIIPMVAEHVPEVVELWSRTKSLILTYSDNTTDLARYFADNPQMSHVAIRAGRIIGAVLCGHDGRRGYLHHLAVTATHRSQGIGRALVDACLSKLQETDIGQCNVFIVDDNEEGRRFWSSLGWSEWADIRLMSKCLEKTQ